MPTSTGTADRGRLRRGKARGFTLVELMVVLTIF
jgi:general secretion pathway protein H